MIKVKLLKENMVYRPSYRTAYHGTTKERASEILKNGFKINTGEKSGHNDFIGVSFSVEEGIAEEHARWASEKFDDTPVVIIISALNLNIANGAIIFGKLFDQYGFDKSLSKLKEEGYDAAELFDISREEGLEEMEIRIFNPDKIKIIDVVEV